MIFVLLQMYFVLGIGFRLMKKLTVGQWGLLLAVLAAMNPVCKAVSDMQAGGIFGRLNGSLLLYRLLCLLLLLRGLLLYRSLQRCIDSL